MSRTRARILLAVVAIAALVVLLLLPEVADARVGGGQSFGRGGGSRGFGGGGGGVDGDLIFWLIYLCMHNPSLGIPIVLAVVGFIAVRSFLWNHGTDHRVHRTTGFIPSSAHGTVAAPAVVTSRSVPGLAELQARDTAFSVPVLMDYLVLVHRRAHEAIGSNQWALLLPFVANPARMKLLEAHSGVTSVSEVVVGGISLEKVERRRDHDHLYVRYESSRVETLKDGRSRHVTVRERWVFRRKAGVTSLPPDKITRLGCPNCGASIEVSAMGACRNCDSAITAGQLQWQASFVVVQSRGRADAPEIGWSDGGEESSVSEPLVQAADLAAAMRALTARHTEFDGEAFGKRVEHVFTSLQAAWSAGDWSQARPYVTDRMYQTLRFWIDGYSRNGLRNHLANVKLERVRIVKAEVDAWFESITVRLWASMIDCVVDGNGTVVGGNASTPRRFSEYWTFLRAAGGSADSHGDQPGCPSCGAPLDRVSQSGVCGYCDSKITTGRFDWVLVRIEQPEAYRG